MLKHIVLNSRKVPVPVPVVTLGQALQWIEETLVPASHTITRVTLDNTVLSDHEISQSLATPMTPSTRLDVRVDSPADLAIQTLDAMRNLAAVILGGLKVLAVECWQARPGQKPSDLDGVSNDLQLLIDLIEHVSGLVTPLTVDPAGIQGLGGMMSRVDVSLKMAKANSDWKGSARLLLNRLEPLLKELVNETETLQIRVMTSGGLAREGTGGV